MTKDCKTTPLSRAIFRNDIEMIILLLESYHNEKNDAIINTLTSELEKILNTKKLKKEEKDKKKEQKMIASKAFEEWVRIKKEQYIENKGEQNDKLLKTEKENRKQKEKKSDKPPLPFEAWAKKKENQIN